MQKHIILTGFYICLSVVFLLHLASCAKNERSIQEPRFTNLDIKVFSIDTLQLRVITNDETITDSLFTPDGTRLIPVQYFDPKHRIRLYDAYSDKRWLDTVIDYNSGFTNSLTFFQPSPGGNFLWIGPPVNETLPPAQRVKISFSYTQAVLPDLLRVVVENNVNPGNTLYTPTDSFDLRKSEFSRYFVGYNINTRKVRLKLYSTDGKRKTLAFVDGGDFSEAKEDDYNIYAFRKYATSSGDSIRLIGEKLY